LTNRALVVSGLILSATFVVRCHLRSGSVMFRYLVGSVGKFLECVAFYLKPLACAFCESFFVTVIIPGLFTSISFFDFIRSCTGVSTIISKSKNQLLLSGLSGTATCSEEYFTPPHAGHWPTGPQPKLVLILPTPRDGRLSEPGLRGRLGQDANPGLQIWRQVFYPLRYQPCVP